MSFISKKWKELVYTLTSNDRYAGYHSSKAVNSLADDHFNAANNSGILDQTYADDDPTLPSINQSKYSADERQQAQLVLDAWHIIEDVINIDLTSNINHFNLSESIDDNDYLSEIPDAEDFLNSLSDPCTEKDLRVAQKHLGVILPLPVIQYFLTHDGQEVAPSSTRKLGIIFGLQLLSLAEVIAMTNYWRKVARKEFNSKNPKKQQITRTANDEIIDTEPTFKIATKLDKYTEKDLDNYPDLKRNISKHSKNDYITKLPEQKSFPKGYIKPQYANSNWIPLVTDNAGNYIAVDLDPDVEGKISQVIIFGREHDEKVVVAPNWGEFLLSVAHDFENSENCALDYDPDLDQFDLAYINNNKEVVNYMNVLIGRAKSNFK